MPAIAIRGNFADALSLNFEEIFFNHYNLVGDEYSAIFNKEKIEGESIEYSYVTNLSTIPKATDGSNITYEAPVQGFDVKLTPDTYRKGYKVTLEMLEDDRYNIFSRMPAALGTAMMRTQNQVGANIINNGFDSAVQTGADGLELFSTAHVLAVGGTQKNELTTAAVLSADSLEQALLDIETTTDDQGNILTLIPRILLIPPQLRTKAQKLLLSSQDPDSGNNAINPMAAGYTGLVPMVNHYLTSATQWTIICDVNPLVWVDRVYPSHAAGNEFDTDNAKFKVRARFIPGWRPEPWGVFSTPGA